MENTSSSSTSKSRDRAGQENQRFLVYCFGLVLALLFSISHLKGDYPPPSEELAVWIETWGEFSMLPFVKIAAEKYRLAQAIFITPLMIAVWILMAGSAKILSILFNGKIAFKQYLNLFAYSFFVFWIIGSIMDTIYSSIFGEYVLRALRLEYGVIIKGIVANFPPAMWVSVLTLGGIYNAIVIHENEQCSLGKVMLMGTATFLWPIILISTLIR